MTTIFAYEDTKIDPHTALYCCATYGQIKKLDLQFVSYTEASFPTKGHSVFKANKNFLNPSTYQYSHKCMAK